MPPTQHRFGFARPLAFRRRSVRSAFRPAVGEGGYKLPRDIKDRLALALAGFRNRDAAFALALFIARFWSAPGRVSSSFPIDRRALADREDLGLTEARVRGAIKTLEAVGFLDRAIAQGSPYKPTEDGLRRKPIWFVFGSDYGPDFIKANERAAAARGARSKDRRSVAASPVPPPSMPLPGSSFLNSPKSSEALERSVLMGEVRKGIGIPPKAFQPDPGLEAALERLKRAIGGAEGGSSGSGK